MARDNGSSVTGQVQSRYVIGFVPDGFSAEVIAEGGGDVVIDVASNSFVVRLPELTAEPLTAVVATGPSGSMRFELADGFVYPEPAITMPAIPPIPTPSLGGVTGG